MFSPTLATDLAETNARRLLYDQEPLEAPPCSLLSLTFKEVYKSHVEKNGKLNLDKLMLVARLLLNDPASDAASDAWSFLYATLLKYDLFALSVVDHDKTGLDAFLQEMACEVIDDMRNAAREIDEAMQTLLASILEAIHAVKEKLSTAAPVADQRGFVARKPKVKLVDALLEAMPADDRRIQVRRISVASSSRLCLTFQLAYFGYQGELVLLVDPERKGFDDVMGPGAQNMMLRTFFLLRSTAEAASGIDSLNQQVRSPLPGSVVQKSFNMGSEWRTDDLARRLVCGSGFETLGFMDRVVAILLQNFVLLPNASEIDASVSRLAALLTYEPILFQSYFCDPDSAAALLKSILTRNTQYVHSTLAPNTFNKADFLERLQAPVELMKALSNNPAH